MGRGGSKRGAPRWPRGRRRPWRRAAPVGTGKLGPWLWGEAERRGESVVGFVRRLEQRRGQWRGDGETTTFDGVSCRGPPGARGECGRRQGCRCVGKTGGGGGSFGQSSARGRPVAAPAYCVGTASPRRERKQRRERYSNGRLVINSKFQSSVCKFSFSPCSRGQMKNF